MSELKNQFIQHTLVPFFSPFEKKPHKTLIALSETNEKIPKTNDFAKEFVYTIYKNTTA